MGGNVRLKTSQSFLIARTRTNCYILPLLFGFLANRAWRLMCRHCACSCKINSCIFKGDANESAWWTGLLAWNLITSIVPFANEFTFPLCLYLSFFILLSFTLHVPCNPLCRSMSWIRNLFSWQLEKKKKKKRPTIPNTHLIFYTTKWLLLAERKRHKEKCIQRFQLSSVWFSRCCF